MILVMELAELRTFYDQLRKEADDALQQSGGRLTLEVGGKYNDALAHLLDIRDIEIIHGKTEIRDLKKELDIEREGKAYFQQRCERLEHALETANRVRDQHERAVLAMARKYGEARPATTEEMTRDFGAAPRRAGKQVSHHVVVKYSRM